MAAQLQMAVADVGSNAKAVVLDEPDPSCHRLILHLTREFSQAIEFGIRCSYTTITQSPASRRYGFEGMAAQLQRAVADVGSNAKAVVLDEPDPSCHRLILHLTRDPPHARRLSQVSNGDGKESAVSALSGNSLTQKNGPGGEASGPARSQIGS